MLFLQSDRGQPVYETKGVSAIQATSLEMSKEDAL